MENPSDKSSNIEDPMVAQDKPVNKMNRGLFYGGILVVVIIILLVAFSISVKHSKDALNKDTVIDSTYSNSSSLNSISDKDSVVTPSGYK
jgi:uncharacterized membrane protein